MRLQTKLAVGERGDRYEQEADRIAAQMLASEGPRRAENGTGHISRDGHWPVGPTAPANVPPIIHEVLNSPGQPLDEGTRSFFEPRFGHDFSQVRVHADSKATEFRKGGRCFCVYRGPSHRLFARSFRPQFVGRPEPHRSRADSHCPAVAKQRSYDSNQCRTRSCPWNRSLRHTSSCQSANKTIASRRNGHAAT